MHSFRSTFHHEPRSSTGVTQNSVITVGRHYAAEETSSRKSCCNVGTQGTPHPRRLSRRKGLRAAQTQSREGDLPHSPQLRSSLPRRQICLVFPNDKRQHPMNMHKSIETMNITKSMDLLENRHCEDSARCGHVRPGSWDPQSSVAAAACTQAGQHRSNAAVGVEPRSVTA